MESALSLSAAFMGTNVTTGSCIALEEAVIGKQLLVVRVVAAEFFSITRSYWVASAGEAAVRI
jgi:hypothetical protein